MAPKQAQTMFGLFQRTQTYVWGFEIIVLRKSQTSQTLQTMPKVFFVSVRHFDMMSEIMVCGVLQFTLKRKGKHCTISRLIAII